MSEANNQLAVALHYDHAGAPRVVAKGKGAIGARIIEVAKANDIPIEENEELYKAVAEVLVFVLRMSGRAR
jgi:flagellar biosynthesis protein